MHRARAWLCGFVGAAYLRVRMTHPHLPPEATPLDAGFLRTFHGSLVALLAVVAALSWLIDPLGAFGTGLLPPVITADRDQKAALYRDRRPPPAIVILGSSRSKTLPARCVEALTGQPAFNFAVNGAGAEDFLAVFRFIRDQRTDSVRELLIGLDPETLQGSGGAHRALESSRFLARYVGGRRWAGRLRTLGADLFGWQAVHGSLESIRRAWHPPGRPPETVIDSDGVQRYPESEHMWRVGTLAASGRVAASIPGILSRYDAFEALDPGRVGDLERLAREARSAGVSVTAFIPPLHPALERAAAGTAWRPRTEETVRLLQALEAQGLLRYVETRGLVGAGADSTAFVDGVHFLAPVAVKVVEAVLGRRDGCAVQ